MQQDTICMQFMKVKSLQEAKRWWVLDLHLEFQRVITAELRQGVDLPLKIELMWEQE